MSEEDDELELEALQRQLDDAFATTRPRRGYEDELWLAIQESRPARSRFGDALTAFFAPIRKVPVAAVAAALIVVLGAGLLAHSGFGVRPGGGAATSQQLSNGGAGPRAPSDFAEGAFGKLPSPVFTPGKATANGGITAPATSTFSGALKYVWAGNVSVGISVARVYRYREPSAGVADQFASGLGAVLRDRPAGFLGYYSATTYTLSVRGTVQSPPSSPAFFIVSLSSMPPLDTTGVGVDGATTNFLAAHRLTPDWPYTVSVDSTGDPVRVRYARRFDVPGYGPAYLVDANGERYGIEVDVSANRPMLAYGLLPLSLDESDYAIASPAQAIAPVVSSPASSSAPTATLTKAELVYVLVPAGDHSFYEPAYLFTGTFQVAGTTYTAHVLAAAVDPSQRS